VSAVEAGPVPLVSFGEDCSCRATAVEALNRTGRECDFVFTSRSIASLEAAVLAGLGVMVLPKSRVPQTSLTIWEDAPLPELPQLYCGIYLREGGDNRAALEELADALGLPAAPLRIECYDISTIQGTNTVGSMVVFEEGRPRSGEYRRFKVKTTAVSPWS
jgi:DNA-binding transcriptional LysR family regulator